MDDYEREQYELGQEHEKALREKSKKLGREGGRQVNIGFAVFGRGGRVWFFEKQAFCQCRFDAV